MREIIEQITAGSPMVGTPFNLVQRPINLGLIKDLIILTSEMAKDQEER